MMAVAQKKPRVQRAIDNLENLSEEEIDNLPDTPGWIRKELKSLKNETRKREAGYLTPEEIAAIMISKSQA
jgi:N-glycosylase/DNA lyase